MIHKVKVKFTLEQAKKAQTGSRGIALLFFNLGARGVGGQSHVPAVLPSGKARYALYRRLGGPQGRFGRERQVPPPPPPGFRKYKKWLQKELLEVQIKKE